MPNLKVHCAISKQRTGFEFEDLHRWIDAHQEVLGVDHRIERHAFNVDESNYIRTYWDDREGEGWATGNHQRPAPNAAVRSRVRFPATLARRHGYR